MLSINLTRPILPIKDSYGKNSISKQSLQSKPQLNAPKDTFTKQIHFGNSLPINPEFNILPNLKLAVKNSLTGVYKNVTKKGTEIEIKLLSGKKVNEIHTDKAGNLTVSGFIYNDKGKLVESMTNHSEKVNITRYYDDEKENLVCEVIEPLKRNSIERHYNSMQKVRAVLIKNSTGQIIKTVGYNYQQNGKLQEKITKWADGTTIIAKYSTKRAPDSLECIRGNISEKQIFEGENAHLAQKIQLMGNGSKYTKDYWPNGKIKRYVAQHEGLLYTENRNQKGLITDVSKAYQGNTYTCFFDNNEKIINGLFRTKNGDVFSAIYEDSRFSSLIGKDGEIVDEKDFFNWYDSFDHIDQEIDKFERTKAPDIVPDSYIDILSKHFKKPPEKERVPLKQRAELSKVFIKNHLLINTKSNSLFTNTEQKKKINKKIIENREEFWGLHHN